VKEQPVSAFHPVNQNSTRFASSSESGLFSGSSGTNALGSIEARPVLGGLHHHYVRI
jgi:hypothetical protein